ncbi:hypothetical protein [Microtetraspora sp. NBRC 16547]|uniref:hypothetical protein n=1 Tax=Microtetraspora sp. NBRC 16547 TaxID=3030993 RepID=UPI00255210A3|nr:hypothetical protein [Microtetraspora sp. NBRC 16547]
MAVDDDHLVGVSVEVIGGEPFLFRTDLVEAGRNVPFASPAAVRHRTGGRSIGKGSREFVDDAGQDEHLEQ